MHFSGYLAVGHVFCRGLSCIFFNTWQLVMSFVEVYHAVLWILGR